MRDRRAQREPDRIRPDIDESMPAGFEPLDAAPPLPVADSWWLRARLRLVYAVMGLFTRGRR